MVVFSRVLCIFLSMCMYVCQRLCNIVSFWLLWYEDCEYSVCGVLWICAYTAVMDQTMNPMFKSFFNIHFNLFQISFPRIFMTISQNIKLYTLNHVCANRSFFLSLRLSLLSFSFHLDDCWQRFMTKFLIALYFRFVFGNFPLFKKICLQIRAHIHCLQYTCNMNGLLYVTKRNWSLPIYEFAF